MNIERVVLVDDYNKQSKGLPRHVYITIRNNLNGKKNMKEVVIVSGCRTAIGEFGGTLRDMNAAMPILSFT
jgi:hypothetical protein